MQKVKKAKLPNVFVSVTTSFRGACNRDTSGHFPICSS